MKMSAANQFVLGAAFLGLATAGLHAEEGASRLSPLRIYANWEASEIESFIPDPGSTPSGYFRETSNASSIWLLQEARLAEHAKVFLGVGGFYFFILPSKSNQYSIGQRSAFGFTDLHAEFEFWSRENGDHPLMLKVGAFPFKYNENAKNLGEYMFRTNAYPTLIFTGGLNKVNSAAVQLNGADLNTKLGGFGNDFLTTVKTDQTPSGSLSLTDMVSYSLGGILTVGGGVMLENLYDPSKIASGKYSVGGQDEYYTLKDGTKKLKSAFVPGSDTAVDSSQLSFKSTKVMLRGAIDLGKLVPGSLLSAKDLRLYFEGILMGTENRPIYYTKMQNRLAYMVGFNFPTFHFLDLLSAEFEYCKNPYPNDGSNASLNLSPTPNPTGKIENGDNLKWTVYAQKAILPGFTISGQVANDHMRLVDYFGHTNDRDVMLAHENWYWALQLGYAI